MKEIKLYIESIYSKKVSLIGLLNILVVGFLFIAIGNVFTTSYIQIEQSEMFLIEYMYQGIQFIKINIVVLCIVLVQQTKHTLGIMILKTIEGSRRKVMIQYVISINIIAWILVSIFYVLFLIVGYFLTEYFYIDHGITLYLRLILFTTYVIMVLMTLYFLSDSIYTSLSFLVLYFFVIVMTGFLVVKEEVNVFVKILLLYVSDLVLFYDLEYSFLYSDIYYLSVVLALFFVLVWRYNKIDLI